MQIVGIMDITKLKWLWMYLYNAIIENSNETKDIE